MEANESIRSWAQLVAEADTEVEDKTAYRFSNGRRFEAAGVHEPEAA
jgi:hypothetical protein